METVSIFPKKLKALSAAIIEILGDPEVPHQLKNQLEAFLENCRENLSQEAQKEIYNLELKTLVPEVLSRLQ